MDKTFVPSFRKRPDRLSVAAAFEIWVAFKIVRIELSETDAKWNDHLGSYVHNI